jgi:beta-glucosidase
VEGYDNESYAEAIAERFAFADVVARNAPSDAELAATDTVIVCTGFEFEGEGRDRSFRLPESENQLIARACELAKHVIVVITSGGGIAMDWHDGTKAVVQCPFTGQRGAEALAAVLAGDVNPSGKLPFTIEQDFADSPGSGYVPKGGSVHDATQGGQPGAEKPSHIDSDQWPYEIHYDEGVYVGYRWYDAKQKPVRYWFGHGLSYTTFNYSDLSIDAVEKDLWEVTLTVKNGGDRSGAEVVQLYVEDRASKADRPKRELKAYDKVFLDPGESRTVRLLVGVEDLAYFDEKADAFTHAAGEYGIHVGSSYADIRLTGRLMAE